MSEYNTGTIDLILSSCGDIGELKARLLPLLQSQRELWVEKIQQIISENNYSCSQLSELCKVSEPAVRKWRKGTLPQNRDMYIRIGFAAGYGLDEMNAFLTRYGRCPQLYVKSLEDTVCMFVLQSKSLPHTYETYLNLLDLIKQEIQRPAVAQGQAYATTYLSKFFAHVRSKEQLIEFVKIHAPSYKQAYSRLYSYIIAFLHLNLKNEIVNDGDGRKASFFSMANESGWSSSLRHCVSEIRNKRWFPLRHKVISLGLHLNMDNEEIDEMLQRAQMEPLYVKNPIEASIVWAIEEAKLSSLEDEIIPDGSSGLCVFVKYVLKQLGLDEEGSYLIDDL